jgi:hypothetical protein
MFPLSIFPLPGELVPLHIFEPRYRQLLNDCETRDISFGIYFNHESNKEKLGSLVKLESVIKRYQGGESDIIVKCTDLFHMDTLFRTYKDKLYPGGDVRFWNVDLQKPVNDKLSVEFSEYLSLLKIPGGHATYSLYQMANDLSLDFDERLRFVLTEPEKQEAFLCSRIRYHVLLNKRVEKSKDIFHLN